jgi:hypothetical protein
MLTFPEATTAKNLPDIRPFDGGLYVEANYDAAVHAYRPGSLASIVTFLTKKEAQAYAQAIGWRKRCVEPVASRISGRVWGLCAGYGLFLKNPFYDIKSGRAHGQPTAEQMRTLIDNHFLR